ncbi:thiamine diphosphokinase [Bacillus sp. V3B]|uniref:thiamine diphosphokinase n=1 Tax=Bacillus sp. V3B TaxID=2804915 RepID=UPI00210E3EC7|nr:thiamine diphosphokinase [Bacillus sp. V3B]MCQ6274050.1 thiamine diphosphokinase [Bacillus sp. V3B]
MIIHILGGGPVDLLPDLSNYHEKEVVWVGVDRGVYTLLTRGIKPDIAFGDFDSVSENEFSLIQTSVHELKTFRPEKDETDMEHALNWAIKQKPELIRIFGATGGRLDHMFANIQLLINPIMEHCHVQIEIIDQKNIIYLKASGTYPINKISNKKYISFIPISGEVRGITLKGFKYPLTECHIRLGSTLCISNELINDCGTFSFSKGILMIVRSTD